MVQNDAKFDISNVYNNMEPKPFITQFCRTAEKEKKNNRERERARTGKYTHKKRDKQQRRDVVDSEMYKKKMKKKKNCTNICTYVAQNQCAQ